MAFQGVMLGKKTWSWKFQGGPWPPWPLLLRKRWWVSVFGHFRSFFEQKIDPKLPRSHFSLKEFTKKYFSSIFQFSAKAMMTPPGDQTVTKKFWLVVNSEVLEGIKNMFSLCEHFFRVSCMFKQTLVVTIFRRTKNAIMTMINFSHL